MIPKPEHPDWSGKTAVVMCNGPSLTPALIDCLGPRPVPTIAVNTAYMLAPWADVLYAGDFMMWRTHIDRMRRASKAQLWTCDPATADRFKVRRWKGVNRPGLGREHIHLNGNSGTQAINLAFLFGARRILLVGMTMREIDGKKHFHGDHEAPLVQKQLFEEWLHKLKFVADDLKAEGCEVINCDPLSAVPYFPFSTLEKELL